MRRSLRKFGVVLFISIAICTQVLSSEQEITQIRQQVEGSVNPEVIRLAMEGLTIIDGVEATKTFASIFEEKVLPLDFRLIPFLSLMYEFQDSSAARDEFDTILQTLDESGLDPNTKVYVVGLLAKFGETDRVSWLISEYREASKSITNLVYPTIILEVLSKINVSEASDFVVDHVLQSGDPTIKLVAVRNMRESGNPGAIDIMRGWASVESGEFDLVIADTYLQAISDFGDERDLEFLSWLDQNAEIYFAVEDIETQIKPLLIDARNGIDLRSSQVNVVAPAGPVNYAMWTIGGLLLAFFVYLIYSKRSRGY